MRFLTDLALMNRGTLSLKMSRAKTVATELVTLRHRQLRFMFDNSVRSVCFCSCSTKVRKLEQMVIMRDTGAFLAMRLPLKNHSCFVELELYRRRDEWSRGFITQKLQRSDVLLHCVMQDSQLPFVPLRGVASRIIFKCALCIRLGRLYLDFCVVFARLTQSIHILSGRSTIEACRQISQRSRDWGIHAWRCKIAPKIVSSVEYCH